MNHERVLLVDASVVITLAEIGTLGLLRDLDGRVEVPRRVVEEVTSRPAASDLDRALGDWIERRDTGSGSWEELLESAATHLGRSEDASDWGGDVALLASALRSEDTVVVTDDKPLRQTCKALSIPVSGSIGVLVRAVERGDLAEDEAKAKLEAMDEVGARLSASLYRKAERMIEDAAGT